MGDRAGQRAGPHLGEQQGLPEVGAPRQGARLPDRGGQEEPGPHGGAGYQAAAEDQDVQEADRGGGGDCGAEPGQVQEGAAGAGGERGAHQDGGGAAHHHPSDQGRILLLDSGGARLRFSDSALLWTTNPARTLDIPPRCVDTHFTNVKGTIAPSWILPKRTPFPLQLHVSYIFSLSIKLSVDKNSSLSN